MDENKHLKNENNDLTERIKYRLKAKGEVFIQL